MSDFESECRREFKVYCECYKAAAYHSLKRLYVEKAYAVIDAWLDWLSVQTL